MYEIYKLTDLVLQLYTYILIASVIMSWLYAFNLVNPYNQGVRTIGDFIYRFTEPVLGPIRRVVPSMGGLDFSPIIAFIGIYLIRQVLWNTFGAPALYSRGGF